MKLIDVTSATATAIAGRTDFMLVVTFDDEGNGDHVSDFPFTLDAGDWEDMSDQVTAWMAAHPDFAVAPYVPPVLPTPPLAPYQFMRVVSGAFPPTDQLDPLSGLKTIIAGAITDDAQKYAALSMLIAPPGGLYFITDPLFSNPALLSATGKTTDDIAAMWQAGLAL